MHEPGDIADSPRASHRDLPSSHCDTLRDHLLDPICTYSGPLPLSPGAFKALASTLVETGLAAAREAGVLDDAPALDSPHIRFLQLIASDHSDRRLAIRATCWLRILRVEGRSFDKIGASFGLTRAAVQTIYRHIQKAHPALRAPGDKSDESREQCRRRRTGVRKARVDWPTSSLWRTPIPLP